MGVKDLDFKKILMDKGERIGLGVAVVIMALLLVSGVGKVLSGGTPSGTAMAIEELKKRADSTINNAEPGPIDENSFKEYVQGTVRVFKVPLDRYALQTPFFSPSSLEDNKRRNPEILQPTEFSTDVARVGLRFHIIQGKQVYVLRDKSITTQGNLGGSRFGPGGGGRSMMMGMSGGGGGMRGGGMGMGGMGMGMGSPPGGDSGAGGPGGGGLGSSDGGAGAGMGGPGAGMGGPGLGQNEPKKLLSGKFEDMDKLGGMANAKLAEKIEPYQFAVISGSFPFEQQLQEFRRALKKKNLNELFDLFANEQNAWGFRGLEIRRRVLDAQGNVKKDWQENFDKEIDAATRYIKALSVELEPVDPKLLKYGGIVNTGLVAPTPKLIRDQKFPEPRLEGLTRTIAKLDEANKVTTTRIMSPIERKFQGKDIDPYDPTGGESAGQDPQGGMGNMGMGPGGAGGIGGAGRGGAGGNTPGSMPDGAGGQGGQTIAEDLPEPVVPEMCLVRFMDPFIEPGNTYEYQIKVRMKNPNYNRKGDVAFASLSKSEVLVSKEWSPVARVKIPPLSYYYLTDEKPERSTRVEAPSKEKAPMQIQSWVPFIPTSKIEVADWVIAERFLVQRGEYISEKASVKIPIWSTNHDAFQLAHSFDQRQRQNQITLDFTSKPTPNSLPALVVDFEGGESIERMAGKSVKEKVPIQMLILTPEGKMIVRNSETDTEDAERQDRVKARRDWIKEVESGGKKPGAGGGMFDRGGGGAPGGPGGPGGAGKSPGG